MQSRATAIHLGPALPPASSSQPAAPYLPKEIKGRAVLKTQPIWPCTGRGLQNPPVTRRAGGLLPRHFTLTQHHFASPTSVFDGNIDDEKWCWAVSFLLPCPWGRPRSPLATSLPYGVRTFLRRLLWRQRPPGVLRRSNYRANLTLYFSPSCKTG